MFTRNKLESPRRERGGLVSHILLAEGDVAGRELTVDLSRRSPGFDPASSRSWVGAGLRGGRGAGVDASGRRGAVKLA